MRLDCPPEDKKLAYDPFLLKATAIVGSGGFIFGYDIGVISGTLSTLSDVFNLSNYEEGLVVSILYAGSIVGCIFGGPLCDRIGRWRTIQVQNGIFILGALLTGLSENIGTLCFGRFLVGAASALSGLADVPYLTEIAPQEYRGIISGQYEILVALGILVSFCLDLGFSTFSSGWRVAFLLPGIFALLQSTTMFLLPESPKWLISKGCYEQAKDSLCQVYGAQRVNALLDGGLPIDPTGPADIQELILVTYKPLCSELDKYGRTSSLSVQAKDMGNENERNTLHEYLYAIQIGLAIQILSQITGANVVRNYAPTIFEDSGASQQLSLVLNIVLGVIKFVFTLLTVSYVEQIGRKQFLVIGGAIVALGMLFLMIASAVSRDGDLQNPFVFIAGCSLIYAGFGVGYGPIPWILSSEMVPTVIRGRVMSFSLIASNFAQLIMNFLFLPLCEGFTTAGAFAVFLVLNIITIWVVHQRLVETKDVFPDHILRRLLTLRIGADNADALRSKDSQKSVGNAAAEVKSQIEEQKEINNPLVVHIADDNTVADICMVLK